MRNFVWSCCGEADVKVRENYREFYTYTQDKAFFGSTTPIRSFAFAHIMYPVFHLGSLISNLLLFVLHSIPRAYNYNYLIKNI